MNLGESKATLWGRIYEKREPCRERTPEICIGNPLESLTEYQSVPVWGENPQGRAKTTSRERIITREVYGDNSQSSYQGQ